MKTLIFLLLFPCFCNAQKHLYDSSLYLPNNYEYTFMKTSKPTIKVFDGKQKLIAEVDTLNKLNVYGDTLSVLKALFQKLQRRN